MASIDSPSSWRQQRRLSVGALSDDWLEDPLEEEEEDLLAADDFLPQSPLQPLPLQQSDSEQEQDVAKERLFATAGSRGRLRRSSSSPRCPAHADDIGTLTGMRRTCVFSASVGWCPENSCYPAIV